MNERVLVSAIVLVVSFSLLAWALYVLVWRVTQLQGLIKELDEKAKMREGRDFGRIDAMHAVTLERFMDILNSTNSIQAAVRSLSGEKGAEDMEGTAIVVKPRGHSKVFPTYEWEQIGELSQLKTFHWKMLTEMGWTLHEVSGEAPSWVLRVAKNMQELHRCGPLATMLSFMEARYAEEKCRGIVTVAK